jgi:hypothetical protein
MWGILCKISSVPRNIVMHLSNVELMCIHNHYSGPLHTWAKSRDLVMVRTLDSHPKAVPWVVGKPFYVETGPQALVCSENGPCSGIVAYFVGPKRGEDLVNIICSKLYQFERATWLCSFVCLSWNLPCNKEEICHEICHARGKNKK